MHRHRTVHLTDEEIRSGLWVHENQVDPGTYYAIVHTIDYECSENPSCIEGYSNLLTVTILKPAQRYSGRVAVYRFLRVVTLRLRIEPLGEISGTACAGGSRMRAAAVSEGRSMATPGAAT